MHPSHLWAQPLHGHRLGAWDQVEVVSADGAARGPFHPGTLWHIMAKATGIPPADQSPAQVQQVAQVALWGIPAALVVGALGMHLWMGRKKRR